MRFKLQSIAKTKHGYKMYLTGVRARSRRLRLAVETGFASEDPPEAALDPKRIFEVLVDEVEDCQVKLSRDG